MNGQYQLFDPLREEEYAALKADIAKRGVLVPVEVDEQGNILDGHHRERACRELGLLEPPRITRIGLNEQGKIEHVLKLNLLRRHLGAVGWAKGFKQLAEVRGVVDRLDGKGGRPKENAATVAALAEEVGVKPRTARYRLQVADELAPHPDLAAKVDAGEMEVKRAQRTIRERAAAQRRDEPAEPIVIAGSIDLRVGDFRAALADLEPGTVDAIITDPPYPQEYLPLYSDLSALASRVLRRNGVLAVMTGQLHLPEYIERLGEHMRWRWCGAYIATGTHTRIHPARVATAWKPILVYQTHDATEPPWFLDYFASGGNDKEHHNWGQSESGMAALVERLTGPGQLVCDPFLGGGTTGIVCRDLGRRFIGCEIDPAAYHAARERLA